MLDLFFCEVQGAQECSLYNRVVSRPCKFCNPNGSSIARLAEAATFQVHLDKVKLWGLL